MVRTQETTINWVSGDERVSIFTTDRSVIAELVKAGFQVEVEGEHEFMVPVSAIRFSGTKTKTGKAKRELTAEQRTAIGVRLQTAKAAKFGLTMDQYKSLKLRPGQTPMDQLNAGIVYEADIMEGLRSVGLVETAKPKKVRKTKGTDQRARVKAAATKPTAALETMRSVV